LSRPDKCVLRRSVSGSRMHCAARHTPTQSGYRKHLSGGRLNSHRHSYDKTVVYVVCVECRAVFKVGGYWFPKMLRRKFFGNVKKHAQRNASADALYVCTIVMPCRKSRLASIKCKKADPAGRAYSAHPGPLADKEGTGCPPTQNPTPVLGLSGLACLHNPPQFFGNVKKHTQRNASADALYVCTIVMPGKSIWRL